MAASSPIFAIHTVFVALENILFMEEWLDYHLRYGFNRFYLYDNSKSQGLGKWHRQRMDGSNKMVPGRANKYGVNYRQKVRLSDEELQTALRRLEAQYQGVVHFTDWSPLDEKGKVTYGQLEAHAHCLARMKREAVDWCANIDMDEFIVMGRFNSIGECVAALEEGENNVRMSQVRFHDRFRQMDRLVIDAEQGHAYPYGKACKNIYKVAKTRRLLVHEWEGEGRERAFPIKALCFNHYMLPVDDPAPTSAICNVNPDLKAAVRRGALDYFRAKTPGGTPYQHGIDVWRQGIDALARKRRRKGRRGILHYVYRFSVPTQTFIYDLIRRLEADTPHDNIVLCQKRELQAERPWPKTLCLPWQEQLPAEASREVFAHLVARCGIDLLVVHFAEKTWDLKPLEAATGLRLPMIVMTHGYDAFLLQKPGAQVERVKHVLGDVAQRGNALFTAPSDYLAAALAKGGVAAQKITVAPNTVDPRFFRHRKTRGFYRGQRPLRLLNIGRLYDVKGHRYLLDALARFRRKCLPPPPPGTDRTPGQGWRARLARLVRLCTGRRQGGQERVHLTIVYGHVGDDLEALKAQAKRLGLADCVDFVPFVDLNADPGYLSRFDLYIHSSTYTRKPVYLSESFGLAVLEAIAAGLPVIATDAGATPSVLGHNSPHSRIVRHGSAAALFEALAAMHADPQTFTSNLAYAKARLAAFAPERQTAILERLIHRLTPNA